MRFDKPMRVAQLAELLGARVIGNADLEVTGLNDINSSTHGDVTFADTDRYLKQALAGAATAIIVPSNLSASLQEVLGKVLLLTEHAHSAFDRIVGAQGTLQEHPEQIGVHTTAVVASGALIGNNVSIGPYCVVEEGAAIGDETVLEAHVFVGRSARIGRGSRIAVHGVVHRRCVVGEFVRVGSAAQIGSEPFYFYENEGALVRGNALGHVVIEDHVDVGAGCTVDRGITSDTRIGQHSKLDNLVHVGHDAQVGRQVRVAAQSGIAGYVRVGDGVVIRGQVGISHRVQVGRGARILGKAGVNQDVAEGSTVVGVPATTATRYAQRRRALVRRVVRLEQAAEQAGGLPRTDTERRIVKVVAAELGVDVRGIGMHHRLKEDLGVDSLEWASLALALQDEFGADLMGGRLDRQATGDETVSDLVATVTELLALR